MVLDRRSNLGSKALTWLPDSTSSNPFTGIAHPLKRHAIPPFSISAAGSPQIWRRRANAGHARRVAHELCRNDAVAQRAARQQERHVSLRVRRRGQNNCGNVQPGHVFAAVRALRQQRWDFLSAFSVGFCSLMVALLP